MQYVIPALWIAWLLYWMVAARDVKAAQWRESPRSEALHRTPLWLAVILLAVRDRLPPVLHVRFLPQEPAMLVLGAIIVAAGLGFSVWARRHLGGNWSAAVTLKEEHALIRTGPYRYVRHPIYTGMLLAFLGTAVAIGEWYGLLAFTLATSSFVLKSRMEERRLRATFPQYDQYRRETSALIPFVY
ncbi:MAG TPA: isoprenylcysteine carboxylmethyltransferase family protein [Gemmatimonadaceae bacterium]